MEKDSPGFTNIQDAHNIDSSLCNSLNERAQIEYEMDEIEAILKNEILNQKLGESNGRHATDVDTRVT